MGEGIEGIVDCQIFLTGAGLGDHPRPPRCQAGLPKSQRGSRLNKRAMAHQEGDHNLQSTLHKTQWHEKWNIKEQNKKTANITQQT